MATHDRFQHIEEYEHILRQRRGITDDHDDDPNYPDACIVEVDSEGNGQELGSPIRHSDDEEPTDRNNTGEHNGSSKDIDFKRPRL